MQRAAGVALTDAHVNVIGYICPQTFGAAGSWCDRGTHHQLQLGFPMLLIHEPQGDFKHNQFKVISHPPTNTPSGQFSPAEQWDDKWTLKASSSCLRLSPPVCIWLRTRITYASAHLHIYSPGGVLYVWNQPPSLLHTIKSLCFSATEHAANYNTCSGLLGVSKELLLFCFMQRGENDPVSPVTRCCDECKWGKAPESSWGGPWRSVEPEGV